MPIRILLVDDNVVDRMAVGRALQRTPLDANLREAASGAVGIRLLQEEAFDCVLLDYQLPDMDGLEFLKHLAVLEGRREVPIVMLTGQGSEAIAVDALKHGVQDYLVKGQVAGDLLVRTIRYAIERQRSEEALRQQRAWLDATLASIGDAVIATDTRGMITFLNPVAAGLTGWSPEAARGRHIDEVLRLRNEQTQQAVASPVARVLQEGVVLGLANHTELLTRDGQAIPIADSAAPIRSGSGRLYGVVLIFRDISKLKQLEAQLRQSQKMEAIGALAGGIAHDFNNMLAAILGFTELATYDIPSASPAWRSLQQVLTAGRRARDLVQQILAFSRQTPPTYQPVRLPVLLQEALALLRASLPSTIAMQEHLAAEVGTVLADSTQIHQVVMNLCANAEYAMRETGGVLEVHLEAVEVGAGWAAVSPDLSPGSYARLRIRDTGPGIAPDVLPRIFEPFFTTKDVGHGTGMGLAMVHGIVRNHGGAITVASPPGQGATFEVYLPRSVEGPPPAPCLEEALPRGHGRLLLIEDEVAMAHLGQAALERLGYEVVVCLGGFEALEALRVAPQRFDLVVTDQTMPGMTGEALVGALRRIRPDLPVILCTGFSYTMDAAKAAAGGIDAFLAKPWAVRDLAHTVQRVLEQRRASARR